MRIDRVRFCTELARKDMTLKKLSDITGVSRQTLSYIKQGKSCTDEIGNKIAGAFKINLSELIES